MVLSIRQEREREREERVGREGELAIFTHKMVCLFSGKRKSFFNWIYQGPKRNGEKKKYIHALQQRVEEVPTYSAYLSTEKKLYRETLCLAPKPPPFSLFF